LKIYTRGGDAGETVLIGGARVPKDDPRVVAYGAVDKLNSAIGLALALGVEVVSVAEASLDDASRLDAQRLHAVQEDLFAVGARLAAADPDRALRKGTIHALDEGRVAALEHWIDEMDAVLTPLDTFVLPGGSPAGAQLHVARTVCRRAEGHVVGLLDDQPDLAQVILPYLNRLSDTLFTLARRTNARAGTTEPAWRPQRQRGSEAGPKSEADHEEGDA